MITRAGVPLALAALGASLLRRFPPETYNFYPRCPVYEVLHLRCPGCGGTRALAALLRGDVAGAWHWNALIVLGLPMGAALAVLWWVQRVRGERPLRVSNPLLLGGMLSAAVVFGVIRNFVGC